MRLTSVNDIINNIGQMVYLEQSSVELSVKETEVIPTSVNIPTLDADSYLSGLLVKDNNQIVIKRVNGPSWNDTILVDLGRGEFAISVNTDKNCNLHIKKCSIEKKYLKVFKGRVKIPTSVELSGNGSLLVFTDFDELKNTRKETIRTKDKLISEVIERETEILREKVIQKDIPSYRNYISNIKKDISELCELLSKSRSVSVQRNLKMIINRKWKVLKNCECKLDRLKKFART